MLRDDPVRRVMVTGSEGYIGSVLTPLLVRMGFRVLAVDAGWFDDHAFIPGTSPARLLKMDVRDLEREHLCGVDAIVHLAGVSGSAAGELDADATMDINHRATVRLAELARAVGVHRFVLFSSCEVYHHASNGELADESTPVEPEGVFARSKLLAERDLLALQTDGFHPTCLRLATTYGISPRQRFDVLLPRLAGDAWVNRSIHMTSDGSGRQPLVHLRDVIHATVCCLSSSADSIGGRCFNVGGAEANCRLRDVVEAIHHQLPACEIDCQASAPGDPGYGVRFDAIHRDLPGFAVKWDLGAGVSECLRTFDAIGLDERTLDSPAFNRPEAMRLMLERGRLGCDFRLGRSVAESA